MDHLKKIQTVKEHIAKAKTAIKNAEAKIKAVKSKLTGSGRGKKTKK
jgi:hypothetical protein